MALFSKPAALFGLATASLGAVKAFDLGKNDNLIVYWGQNSYGAVNKEDTANWQKPIGEYCDDDTVDLFLVAFLTQYFATGDLPTIDLANTCNATTSKPFEGTELLDCSFLEKDFKKCQDAGKPILLSMGGQTGGGVFESDDQAKKFADTVWDVFLGGKSDTRPFGAVSLDGIDLDIEGGGGTGYTAFVNQLHTHFDGADKSYYVSAAPQCPYPDAYLGTVLNEAEFSFVAPQFYNNFCANDQFPGESWDYPLWDDWAKNNSKNRDVKLFVGAPASKTAATSGYVEPDKLSEIATSSQSKFKTFGGVMLWDESQSVVNDNYGGKIKKAMTGNSASAMMTAQGWQKRMVREIDEGLERLKKRMSRVYRF